MLNYTPPPGDFPGFPGAERVRPKGGRPSIDTDVCFVEYYLFWYSKTQAIFEA